MVAVVMMMMCIKSMSDVVIQILPVGLRFCIAVYENDQICTKI